MLEALGALIPAHHEFLQRIFATVKEAEVPVEDYDRRQDGEMCTCRKVSYAGDMVSV